MEGEAGMAIGAGGCSAHSPAMADIIAWPGTKDPADRFWQVPLLEGVRAWAMAASAGLCPLRNLTGTLVADGRAGWVAPLDRFMRTLCLAAARPLKIAPPGHPDTLPDEARLLTALQAVRQRRTSIAREQLCALVSPECIGQVFHSAILVASIFDSDMDF